MIDRSLLCPSPSPYIEAVLRHAEACVGVRERRSNRGPEVDEYVRSVGLDPRGRHPWCMCWICWVHAQAAAELGGRTTCPRTAGAVRSWKLARRRGLECFTPRDIEEGRATVQPGDQFIRVRRRRADQVARARTIHGRSVPGHTGLVVALDADGTAHTIEGNTNSEGSREGDGVYRKTISVEMPELVGFVRHALVARGER